MHASKAVSSLVHSPASASRLTHRSTQSTASHASCCVFAQKASHAEAPPTLVPVDVSVAPPAAVAPAELAPVLSVPEVAEALVPSSLSPDTVPLAHETESIATNRAGAEQTH